MILRIAPGQSVLNSSSAFTSSRCSQPSGTCSMCTQSTPASSSSSTDSVPGVRVIEFASITCPDRFFIPVRTFTTPGRIRPVSTRQATSTFAFASSTKNRPHA